MMVKEIGSRKPLKLRDRRHGTAAGYSYHKCRCNKCREAYCEAMAESKIRRNSQLQPEDHGKATTYTNALCRCDLCREAYRVSRQDFNRVAKARQRSYEKFRPLKLDELA